MSAAFSVVLSYDKDGMEYQSAVSLYVSCGAYWGGVRMEILT